MCLWYAWLGLKIEYRKKVLEVVFEYDLHMSGRIGECRVDDVEILLRPVIYETMKGEIRKRKDETRKSTPALPKASLSVVISAVSIPLLVVADVY